MSQFVVFFFWPVLHPAVARLSVVTVSVWIALKASDVIYHIWSSSAIWWWHPSHYNYWQILKYSWQVSWCSRGCYTGLNIERIINIKTANYYYYFFFMHLSGEKSLWGNPSMLPLPIIIFFFSFNTSNFIYLFIIMFLLYQQHKLPWVDEIYKIFTFSNKQYFCKTKYNWYCHYTF